MTLLVSAGQDCSLIDACATNPCANGARCTNWNNHYNCSCPPGYQGKNCRNDIDECRKPGKCLNGGICMNTHGSYRCDCLAGYSGRTCEVPTQPCAPSQCLNGGTCHQTGDHTYECACLPGTNRQKACMHSCRHAPIIKFPYSCPTLGIGVSRSVWTFQAVIPHVCYK